jgi:hypothetical protein
MEGQRGDVALRRDPAQDLGRQILGRAELGAEVVDRAGDRQLEARGDLDRLAAAVHQRHLREELVQLAQRIDGIGQHVAATPAAIS